MRQKSDNIVAEREINIEERKELKFDVLTKGDIWAYGVGHFLNDLCAACWFNYLLIYLKSINPIFPGNPDLTSTFAGYAMLSGQVADAISNPIVGIYSDKTKTAIGRRKPWYLGGTLLVNICFLFIFRSCLFCEWFGGGDGMALFYYILFPSAFNLGWSAVQISHMALVPSLSSSRKMRDKLSTLRNTFTYVANFSVLVIALIMFAIVGTGDTNSKDNSSTILCYELIVYVLLGIGDLTSLFFIFKVNEPHLTKDIKHQLQIEEKKRQLEKIENEHKITQPLLSKDDDIDEQASEMSGRDYEVNVSKIDAAHSSVQLSRKSSASEAPINLREWFSCPMFYQYGLAYMGMRVLINVGAVSSLIQSMLQFYIVYVLEISSEAEIKVKIPLELALIPMVLYIFSVAGSFVVDKIFMRIGRKKTLLIAVALVIIADVFLLVNPFIQLLNKDTKYLMYVAVAILGVGQALSLNTSYSMISEVIGQKGNQGAFVFGCYSFAEKLMNGIILFVIMNSYFMAANNPTFIRSMIVYVPTAACILAAVLILFGKAKDYKTVGEKNDEDDFVE